MKIGMTLPTMIAGLDRGRILEWIRRIEAGPYATIAAGERITFPNQELMVTLAAAAALTERVRIAFTVVVLPMHSEVMIAKQIATLDVISGGRVSLGVGIGGRDEDYRAVGGCYERRGARMREQVERMRRQWRGEAVVPGAEPIGPPPVQPGGPEVLAGSIAPDGVRRAARWADGIAGFSLGPDADEVSASLALAADAWKSAGRSAPPRYVTSCWFALGAGAPQRLDAYARRYLGIFGEDVAAGMARMCRASSGPFLREVGLRLRDAGVDEWILVPTTDDPDEVDRAADALGDLTS